MSATDAIRACRDRWLSSAKQAESLATGLLAEQFLNLAVQARAEVARCDAMLGQLAAARGELSNVGEGL